jgi:magnesium chelatase subunit I
MNHQSIDIHQIQTFGQLKHSGYQPKSIREEVRDNLIAHLKAGKKSFEGIVGYEDSVIPDTERALMSRHNILFLGLRGQAKTRMARQITRLLDPFIPIVAGSEINDDPFHPISLFARKRLQEMGDDTPIQWVSHTERYGEKLATPDVTVADLIGDIDPIKAANLRLSFSDEEVIHYGIIPRSNRCVFVINEIPDLQARIQVALFNILEEGDIQIRGFKLRMPLDILFVFTANPEDYTNRGSIVTPLKDRIQSQILTHYPKRIEDALAITEQEAALHAEQTKMVLVHPLIKRIIEQVAFEARENEYVDKKSGVSARLTISAFENAVSTAERRAILNGDLHTQLNMGDLLGIIPAITGKIELVYEGEQEGPFQVAMNLLDKSIRTIFSYYFPQSDQLKRRTQGARQQAESREKKNPFRSIIQWFDAGNGVQLVQHQQDEARAQMLYQVDGLYALVKEHFPQATEPEKVLWMEFVLHGLAGHSLISKRVLQQSIQFNDLIGSMVDLGGIDLDESEEP